MIYKYNTEDNNRGNLRNRIIHTDSLFMVEGKDEMNFIDALLKHLFRRSSKSGHRGCDVRSVGGRTKFGDEFGNLVRDEAFLSGRIRRIVIIRDAEESLPATIQSMQGVLAKYNLPSPPDHGAYADDKKKKLRVGFFIMPGRIDGGSASQSGMLEDLCLAYFRESKREMNAYMETYIEALRQAGAKSKNMPKTRALAMLSSSKDSPSTVGIAACQGFFDFSASVFDELRDFVKKAWE